MVKINAIRLKKQLKNKLLERRQFLVEVFHESNGTVSKTQLAEEIANRNKVSKDNVVISNCATKFGGGRTTALGFIYDNKDALTKFEPKYRLRRAKILGARDLSKKRRQKKELKNKMKKFRGAAKANAAKAVGAKKRK